jgi:hypothetical protein
MSCVYLVGCFALGWWKAEVDAIAFCALVFGMVLTMAGCRGAEHQRERPARHLLPNMMSVIGLVLVIAASAVAVILVLYRNVYPILCFYADSVLV